jgi:hypothetical protein
MTKELRINANDYLETLFSATRYAIGRHSYVVSDAEDYAKIISRNRDKFSEGRLSFLARDIRVNISNQLQWTCDNIRSTNCYNDRCEFDTLSLMMELIQAKRVEDFEHTIFTFDCRTGEVEMTKSEETYNFGAFMAESSDLFYWQMLADTIDRRVYEVHASGYVLTCLKSWSWDRQEKKAFTEYHNINKNWCFSVPSGLITKVVKIWE